MLIRMLALAALVPLALFAACGDDDDESADDATTPPSATANGGGETQELDITAADFSFSPASITVEEGQEVTVNFTNSGAQEHSFTVGDEDVTEAEGGEEGTGSFTVTDDMTEFHCKYHPTTMTGTITVGAGAANLQPTSTGGSGSGVSYGY